MLFRSDEARRPAHEAIRLGLAIGGLRIDHPGAVDLADGHEGPRRVQRGEQEGDRARVGATAVVPVRGPGEDVPGGIQRSRHIHPVNVPPGALGSKASWWYACAMYATMLGLLTGCGGGADYTLSLTPVVAVPQTPFEGADDLELVLIGEDGEETRVSLGTPSSGETPSIGDLPALHDTRIAVEGWFGDEMVMRGLTEPLNAVHGKVSTDVFVAETENAAWFSDFPDGMYHPMLATLGGGRFWLGGGMANKALSGLPEKGQSATYELTLAPPEDGLGFVETGTLPTYVDADDTNQEERAYAGFTPLTVAGSDEGRILVTEIGRAHV